MGAGEAGLPSSREPNSGLDPNLGIRTRAEGRDLMTGPPGTPTGLSFKSAWAVHTHQLRCRLLWQVQNVLSGLVSELTARLLV